MTFEQGLIIGLMFPTILIIVMVAVTKTMDSNRSTGLPIFRFDDIPSPSRIKKTNTNNIEDLKRQLNEMDKEHMKIDNII